MPFYRIQLPKAKATVFLSGEEVHRLLLKDIDLFELVLARGKAFLRTESKEKQYGEKFSKEESQRLDFLQ